MSWQKRMDHAFQNCPILPLKNSTKLVVFSDCHRGTGTQNDNFLRNQTIYLTALRHYYRYGYCYLEAGDGDELWENDSLSQIQDTHADVFSLLRCFHREGRFFLLYGNHDMERKTLPPLYPGLTLHEGIILQSKDGAARLRITHGHQADWLNSSAWRLARFLVRYFWVPLEAFGITDPTSAAKNNTKKGRLEKRYLHYARQNNCILLTGHTHRPMLSEKSIPYCNSGSCVHPGCITCIEISEGYLHLVRWCESTETVYRFLDQPKDSPPIYAICITREVLAQQKL